MTSPANIAAPPRSRWPTPASSPPREAKNLIDQIADLQVPLFVFTGGDPLKRPDIFELISHAAGKGVHAALTPSATPLLTRDAIFRMKASGLSRLAVSLDGSIPAIHDSIRGIPGTWERTVQAIQWANEAQLPIQVHTVVSRLNIADLDQPRRSCSRKSKSSCGASSSSCPSAAAKPTTCSPARNSKTSSPKCGTSPSASPSPSRPPKPCTTAATSSSSA